MKLDSNGFQYSLGFGKIAESAIARYLIEEKGYAILPVYEIEHPNRKGPRLCSGRDAELALRYLAIRARHIERMKARGAFVENLPHVERYFSRGFWNQEPEIAAQDGDGFKRSWK